MPERLININKKLKSDYFSLKFEDEQIEEEFQTNYLNKMRKSFLLIHIFFFVNLILKISVTYFKYYLSIKIAYSILLFFLGVGAIIFQVCKKNSIKQITNKTLAYCIVILKQLKVFPV
jgi:hypothetical protein